MRVPVSWLRDFVPITLPIRELAHRLTMAGVEVGEVEEIGAGWEHCFVGQVLRVLPHPNADRLKLCEVDIGRQRVTVVCGAPNVAEGQKVALALAGARLYDPRTGKPETLKPTRIRGVLSPGMICSERELGLGEDHTGILVLPEDAPVGTPLRDYLGDAVLHLEVTTNRPDCLSILGVAWEAGAQQGQPVTLPDLSYPEEGEPVERMARVIILDPDLCPRYCAAVVMGVKVGPSPRWMQERLVQAGLRPINNLVDITNYVMLEYGQPLHAFDYHTLRERTVLVRQAHPGETLTTLDGQERRLNPPMLVIADPGGAIALAGIMGGASTEVTDATTAVLLESASFHPFNTRRTASALNLRTEASRRFERGLRPELPPIALRRAVQLTLQIAGGTACRGILDVYPGRRPPLEVPLTRRRLRQVLGMDLPPEEVARVLASLGFPCRVEGETVWARVPFWRADIALEDDLVEEVARTVGYERVPTRLLGTPIPYHQPDPARDLKERVRDLFVQAGFQEVITYSLVSRQDLQRAGVTGPEPLRVANPMSPEHEVLRTHLRPSLLRTLARNRRHEKGPIRLVEVARVYLPRLNDLPEEREQACALLAGPRTPLSWQKDETPMDFYDAKGTVEAVLGALGVQARYEPCDAPGLTPGRTARILAGETPLGLVGEVDPEVLEAFDLDEGPVAVVELDLPALLAVLPTGGPRFRPLPRYPGAVRDLALVVDREVSAERVEASLRRHPLVARAILFDVYEGPPVPPGKRSLAYRVLFQAPDRTLTGEEVDRAAREVLERLEREVGAVLRQG